MGPKLQVGNLLALYVSTDNFGTDPEMQKPLEAVSCSGLRAIETVPVRAETFGTESRQ